MVGEGILKGSKYGISAASYPNLDIASLTIEQAKQIYLSDYWNKHRIGEMPPEVRWHIFDGVVNTGPGGAKADGAIRWLQRAVGVDDDGKVGPKTLSACSALPAHKLIARYYGQRLHFLTSTMNLVIWQSQGRGLVNRVAGNLMEA